MITRKLYLLLLPFLIVACSGRRKEAAAENVGDVSPEFISKIRTAAAIAANAEEGLTLSGKVECDPEQIVRYIPLVKGVAERTYFSLGDKVRRGQPMIDVRSSELSALLAESVAAETEVEISRRNMQNAQGMYADSMLSDRELLEARARLRQAEAALDRVRADMAPYSHQGGGLFTIAAPADGYVVDKQVSAGSPFSGEGGSLFTVANLSSVWITANVYAGNITAVEEGMEVEVSTLSYPGETFSGKISALPQVFDRDERVLKARIVTPNPELKFKPEMAVVVRLKSRKGRRIIAVPSVALIFDDNRYFVVVEESPGRFVIRSVELSGSYDRMSYISSGLSEGEAVVVENQLLVYSGLQDK